MAQASSSRTGTDISTGTRAPSQSVSYRINLSVSNNVASTEIRDDILTCLVIVLTFWFFASMTLILGIYGSTDMSLGPYTSRLIQTNSIFVQEIKVNEQDEEGENGTMIYGFYGPPALDVPIMWYENHNVSVLPYFRKDWVYYLHEGAHISISYIVKSEELFYPLNLIIAQGNQQLIEWIQNPGQPSNTLSWNLINGNGTISQKIEKTGDYFIALGNLNNVQVEVKLKFQIRTFLYNTSQAYYKCSPYHRECSLKLSISNPTISILTTGPRRKNDSNYSWYVKLSYGPRWITYFIGTGMMTIVILLIYTITNNLLCTDTGENANYHRQSEEASGARGPLLTNKEDDNTSLGSSYESVSHDDEEDSEEWLEKEAAKSLEDGHLCVICCDAQRDCFFLPCGHSATCYTCGLRISEEAGTCPICRRKMKKVRKIFTV